MAMSTSATSGSTAQSPPKYEYVPCVSVCGTRCTRCVPLSNLSRANTPLPRTSVDDFLEARRPFPRSAETSLTSHRPAALFRIFPGTSRKEIAAKERRLVAARSGADFENGVLFVSRIPRQQRQSQALLGYRQLFLQVRRFVSPPAPACPESVVGSAISVSRSALSFSSARNSLIARATGSSSANSRESAEKAEEIPRLPKAGWAKIYSGGIKIHTRILEAFVGDKKNDKKPLGQHPMYVADLNTGRDFKIIKKMVKGDSGVYASYDTSEWLDPTVLGNKDQVEEWFKNMHDLSSLRTLKTFEEMEIELRKYLGQIPKEAVGFDMDKYTKPVSIEQQVQLATQSVNSETKVETIQSVSGNNAVAQVEKPQASPPPLAVDTALAEEDFFTELDNIPK